MLVKAIFSPSGGSVGLAFAIPASTVTSVVDQLEHGGRVNRAYLGVRVQPAGAVFPTDVGMNRGHQAGICIPLACSPRTWG